MKIADRAAEPLAGNAMTSGIRILSRYLPKARSTHCCRGCRGSASNADPHDAQRIFRWLSKRMPIGEDICITAIAVDAERYLGS